MTKEILLYGPIFSQTAVDFINDINNIPDGEDLVVRINTPGGDVAATWSMIAKFQEFKGTKKVKVDGQAMSGGFFFALYADTVEALDVSQFLAHRAAYPDWYEKSYMTEDQKKNLIQVNKSLETAFKARINKEKFEAVTGKKLKDLFSMDSRIDVYMDVKQAKEIGLVTSVTKITPQKKAEVSALSLEISTKYADQFTSIAAFFGSGAPEITEHKLNHNTKTIMNKETLKAEHPDLYASIFKEGVEAEADRAGAWLAFSDADQKAVIDGIKSGKPMTQTQMAEFSQKIIAKTVSTKVEAANPIAVETTVVAEKVEKTAVDIFAEQVKEGLGLTAKTV